MLRGRRAGYSLIELMIAMSLASIVMVAVVSVSSSLIHFQVEGMRKGRVTGWALMSVMTMNREIEDANVLVHPLTGGADWVVVCNNWSRLQSAADKRMDTTLPVRVVYYCFLETGTNPDRPLYRYINVGAYPAVSCPASFTPPACGNTSPGFAYTEMGIVASGVYRTATNPFTREPTGKGLNIDFRIGNPAPTGAELVKTPVPVTMPVKITIAMQKQYGNTSD